MAFRKDIDCDSVPDLLSWITGSTCFSLSLRWTSAHPSLVLGVLIDDREYAVTAPAPELVDLLPAGQSSSSPVHRQVSVAAVTAALEARARQAGRLARTS